MLIANSLIEYGGKTYRPGSELPDIDGQTRALWLTQGFAVPGPDNESPAGGEPPAEPPLTGTIDPAQLEEMTVAELKQLAADMELDVKACKVKADYVAAISAVQVEPGEPITESGEGSEDGGDGSDV